MQNPIFSSKSKFNTAPVVPSSYGAQGADTQTGYEQTRPTDEQFENIKESFSKPAATYGERGRMTYDDVIVRSAITFALLFIGACGAWMISMNNTSYAGLFAMVGILGGFVLAMVNSFKQKPSPALICAYAVFEGLGLGGISAATEMAYPGVVVQAVFATLITFAVCLALFKSKVVRVTPKFTKILLVGLVSYMIFALVSMFTSFFNLGSAEGLRGLTIAGIPLGIVVGLVAVFLASMSLISDFDFIAKGVERGIPSEYAWTAAFGLMVTLVWLYLEFLRLLRYFNSND